MRFLAIAYDRSLLCWRVLACYRHHAYSVGTRGARHTGWNLEPRVEDAAAVARDESFERVLRQKSLSGACGGQLRVHSG